MTFACELDPARLTALFSDAAVIANLQALEAHVALMLSDLSAERAAVVRRLNRAGIPVVAIPLVPVEILRGILWASAHPGHVLSVAIASAWLVSRWRRRARWKEHVGPV